MFEMTQSESATAGVNQAPEEGLSSDAESSSATRKVILVVDSDQLTRLLFRFRLQETGFSVHSAKNGKEAITKLRQIQPDAILLDLFLRDKSAIDLLREIRTKSDIREVPVVALVSKQLTRVERKAAKWTLSKVFEKPYTRSKDIARAFLELFDRHSRSTGPSAEAAVTSATTTDGDIPTSAHGLSQGAPHQFARGIESQIAATRQELQFVAQRATLVEQKAAFSRLSDSVEFLTSAARDEKMVALGLQSAALGGLTTELAANPTENNAGVRKTLAQAIDILYALSNPPASTVVANGETLSAVVIENDKESQSDICSALERAEFASVTFANPSDALSHLETSTADVIILEAALPEQSGYELTSRIRNLPLHCATPILFLTRPGDLEGASQVMRDGRADLATRPFLGPELALKALSLSLKQRIETALRAAYDAPEDRTAPMGTPDTAIEERPTMEMASEPGSALANLSLTGVSASSDASDTFELPTESHPVLSRDDLSLESDALGAVFHVDDSWQLLVVSPEAATLLGNPGQDLVGRYLREWVILGLPTSPSRPSADSEAHDSREEELSGLVVRRGDGRVFTGRLRIGQGAGGAPWACVLDLQAESASVPAAQEQNATEETGVEVSSPTEATGSPRDTKEGSTEILRRLNDFLTIGSELPIQPVAPESPSDSEAEAKPSSPDRFDEENDSPPELTRAEPIDAGLTNSEATGLRPISAEPASVTPTEASPPPAAPADVRPVSGEPVSATSSTAAPTGAEPASVAPISDSPSTTTPPSIPLTGQVPVSTDSTTSTPIAPHREGFAPTSDESSESESTTTEPVGMADSHLVGSLNQIIPLAPTETLPQPQSRTPMQTKNEEHPDGGSRPAAPTSEKHRTPSLDKPAPSECDQDSDALEEVNSVLNDELNQLRHQYATAKQSLAELEARLNDSMRSLANATAQAQREQSERRRFEHRAAALAARLEELHNELKNQLKNESDSRSKIAELEQRLSKRTENEFQSRADFEQESSEKKALEDKLAAVTGMNDALRQQVAQLEKATDDFKTIQHDLESRLKASTTALELASERLKQESADRAKLQSELQKAKESNQTEAREYAVDLARLRSAVQAETIHRRRAESEAVQARCGTVEAERASTAALTKFQQRVRTPVSSMMQDVGRMLESELAPEQRELAEGILANAALVQTNLQDLSTSLAVRRKGTTASSATPPALPNRGNSPVKTPAEIVKETSF